MTKKKRVLWVDELRQFEASVYWFDERYEFVRIREADKALEMVRTGQFDLVIAEFQYVSGFSSAETEGGLEVGAVLYRKIREFNSQIPVVFYHLAGPHRWHLIQSRFHHPDQKVWAFAKEAVRGEEFSEAVIRILD